jgi:hypothetical protein
MSYNMARLTPEAIWRNFVREAEGCMSEARESKKEGDPASVRLWTAAARRWIQRARKYGRRPEV